MRYIFDEHVLPQVFKGHEKEYRIFANRFFERAQDFIALDSSGGVKTLQIYENVMKDYVKLATNPEQLSKAKKSYLEMIAYRKPNYSYSVDELKAFDARKVEFENWFSTASRKSLPNKFRCVEDLIQNAFTTSRQN
jgi:hypothetical protein